MNQDQIKWLNQYTSGPWKLNRRTGLVDIYGSFDCVCLGVTDFKGIKFGTITGWFDCESNQLTSLEGAPKIVGGNFYCRYNNLTSLKGAPESVGGYFVCSYNQLVSLEGATKSVGEGSYFHGNQVSARTLSRIHEYMIRGFTYQNGLEIVWSEMTEEDKMLMYKDHRGLSADERRMYELMNKVKGISI